MIQPTEPQPTDQPTVASTNPSARGHGSKARYVLTGRGKVDRQLSRVINRAWLGDGGGALAVVARRSWDAGYAMRASCSRMLRR